MGNNRSKKVFSNLIWRFMERILAQGVTFLVSIVLARILDPEIYGTIALVTVIITFMQVFVDSGLGNALIQKKDADDLDFSTVFYFNIVACIFLYGIMFLSAPIIASFYNRTELTPIIRVLGLTLVISGIKNVQQAYVSRHLLFRKFFYATLSGTIGAAVVGIFMAYHGFGVWSLVCQSIFNVLVDTIILWLTVRWRPKLTFSFIRLKELFSYGWKLLVASLIAVGYQEIRTLAIGKIYTDADLAYYNRGTQFPKFIIGNINTSIDSVLLPTLSSEQDNKERVRAITRRAIKTSSFLIMPLMVGLAVCAEPLIRLVLTEKWLPTVFYLRVFCFSFAFYPMHTANLNALKAMGRSDYFLKLEIIKIIVAVVALLTTMFISVEAMALSTIITSILSQIINSWPNKKLLNYSYLNQLKDMLPQITLSLVMGGMVFLISFLGLNDVITLIMQILVGGLIYIGASLIFKNDSFQYIVEVIKAHKRS